MPNYAEYVDRGRGKGNVSKAGIKKIGEWVGCSLEIQR